MLFWKIFRKAWKHLCHAALTSTLLRLRKTHNTFQLPVFFSVFFLLLFLCQPGQGLWNCKLVFLILKISQYGRLRWWFNFFQGMLVRIHIRIDISIFIWPMTTKFSRQVHIEELTQMKLSTARVSLATKLDRMVAYLDELQDANLP